MTNPDRGAYTPPTEPPLSFDARQPVRGRGPAPMMLIASALVLAVLVVAILVFYRSGLSQGPSTPPMVGAPVGVIKGAPPATSQPVDPAQGLQIYQQAEGQAPPTSPNFTPPPEQPQARLPNAPPVTAPVTSSTVSPAAPAPAGPVVALPNNAPPALKPTLGAPAPAVKPPAAAPVAAKPAAPAPVAAKPAPAPPKPAAPAPVAAKTVAPKPAAATGGVAAVQIGAFSSRALADSGWAEAARIAPGAAAGKGKKVEAIQKDGATLYRTQVTGFASRADAQAFCAKLKAAGKSCFVK
ncbi:MAG TPA: SPOR domain-containing protein, partial [Phenylobacterium sp.]|nr:SPOR domain-containing protein [Phenylobacterium sp.]